MLLEGNYRNPSHDNGLAEIEKIINQRYFSRDETERLIEIMRSRTPDLSVEDQRAPGSTAKGFETMPFSTPAKLIDPRSSWGTDMIPPSNVHEIGSSPIDVAKAFMEAKTMASVHESQKRKYEALRHGVEAENSASKDFPIVATASSVCWPGSVVQGYPNYLTPQSKKRRTLPQPLSRTPYSGSVYRRSIKNSRHGDAYNKSSGQSQLSTPFSVGSKTIQEDKVASTSGGMVEPWSSSRREIDAFGSTTTLFPGEGSTATKNIALNLQEPDGRDNTESRGTSGHVLGVCNVSRGASVSVHPKSSQTAFKILQQLERTIPSPTSKPLELRQTLAKRNASSGFTKMQFKEHNSSISNGHGQGGVNESGSSILETVGAKKVQEHQSGPNAEESSQEIQSSRANSEIPETHTSQQPQKSGLKSAAEILDNTTSKGFTFTFPVPKAPSSFLEPPPTPTLASPPAKMLVQAEDTPKFTFGSRATKNLVFNFGSTSADVTVPIFKFGSDSKRELSLKFSF